MIALFKHAKNFVAKDESRPLFRGICFDGENAIVTNTHVMIIRKNMPLPSKIIHFKTGQELTGKYPDYKKVIPEKTGFNITYSDIDEFIKALKVAMSLGEKTDYGPICSLEGTFLMARNQNMIFTANLTGTILDKPNYETFFNGKYLYDILNFFKEEGVKEIKIGFNTPLSVFLITSDKDVLALLTPIRTPQTQKEKDRQQNGLNKNNHF